MLLSVLTKRVMILRDDGEVVSEGEGEYDDMPTLEEIDGEGKVEFAVGELLVTMRALNTQVKAVSRMIPNNIEKTYSTPGVTFTIRYVV